MPSIHPYPNELFSALSFIGFVCCCIPFPLHLRAGRTCTVLYMTWVGLYCLIAFVNSIVWNGNVTNWAPVWCDITAKFIVGASVAIPAASLCITHHVYLISRASHATFTGREKRNQLIFDLGAGIGLPILEMILHYIVQGHRFEIFEDIGCYPHSYPVVIGFPILFGIPWLIGHVSITYSLLIIRTLRRSRRRFNDLVHYSADSNVKSNYYVRLMLLATIDIVRELTINLYTFLINIRGDTIYPWISWAHIHQGFSQVDQIPATLWRSFGLQAVGLDTSRWLYVICAFLFFGFFGFSKECMDQYRSVFVWLRTKAGFSPSSQPFCSVIAPLPQMEFKSMPSAGSDGFNSSGPRTSTVTLPESALTRSEFKVDFDVSSSVGQQNYAMTLRPVALSGMLHSSTVDAVSNV